MDAIQEIQEAQQKIREARIKVKEQKKAKKEAKKHQLIIEDRTIAKLNAVINAVQKLCYDFKKLPRGKKIAEGEKIIDTISMIVLEELAVAVPEPKPRKERTKKVQ